MVRHDSSPRNGILTLGYGKFGTTLGVWPVPYCEAVGGLVEGLCQSVSGASRPLGTQGAQ